MTYGHAERTLAAICLLESETRDLLNGLYQLSPEQEQWLDDVDTADPTEVPAAEDVRR